MAPRRRLPPRPDAPDGAPRVRVRLAGDSVAAHIQRHTSVATDFHEFGEMYAHFLGSRKPLANRVVMAGVFQITTCAPYNYGEVDHFYDEIYEFDHFPTGSVRNIPQPDVCAARELMTDQIGRRLKLDAVEFRLGFRKEGR